MHTRKQFGNQAEQLVAHYLEQQGFVILERNYTKRYGEVDLIAHKDEVLAFIEVKARRHVYFDLSQVVTRSKQKKIIAVAKAYIAQHNHTDTVCRFDVALVEGEGENQEVSYLPNAFCEQAQFSY